MSTLFVSYSTKDREISERVFSGLVELGYQPPFRDDHPSSGIPAGSEWEAELYRKLRQCQAVIVLCSKNWFESKWCFAELAYAKAVGKVFLPILIDDDFAVPSSLSERQVTRFSDADAWDRIARGLKCAGISPNNDFPWPIDGLDPCPYPGLASFEAEHAGLYFGRDQEILDLRERLVQSAAQQKPRMLFVVGASGSGKSSLVKAGLLPRLEQKESEYWLVVPVLRWQQLLATGRSWRDMFARFIHRQIRSGEQFTWSETRQRYKGAPANVADALIEDVRDLLSEMEKELATPLLVIDQFEELLTAADQSSVEDFFQFLQRLMTCDRSPWRCLATVRTDFWSEIQTREDLVSWKEQIGYYSLPLMNRERFYDVIRCPAEKVGASFESDQLVDKMVRDTQTDDGLPLLAFTLRELYERHGDDLLFTDDEYTRDLGGLSGCISVVADRALNEITLSNPKEAKEIEHETLLACSKHLVRIANRDGKDEFVRKSARWADFSPRVQGLLNKLIESRLVISRIEDPNDLQSERMVEVCHESIFRIWKRLSDWLDESREVLRWRQSLERDIEAAEDRWAGLTASQFAIAANWTETRPEELTDDEIRWLREARRNERLRWGGLIFATCLFALLSVVAGWYWLRAVRLAQDERIARLQKDEAYEKLLIEQTKTDRAQKTSSAILSSIEDKAQTNVVIHGVLMEAFQHTIEGLEIERLEGTSDPDRDRELGELLIARAWHQNDHGQCDEAIKTYERSLEVLTKLSEQSRGDPELALRCTFVMNNIGWCMMNKGDFNNAIAQQEKTLARRRKLAERFPNEFEAHRQISVSLGNLGSLYAKIGQDEKGMQYSLDGMALEKKLWNEHPNNRWIGLNYSNSLYNISADYLDSGEIDKALEFRDHCYTIRRRLYEDAKAGVPDESGLGFFHFQDKYGKICFLFAQLLISVDIQTERVPELLATAIEVLGDMHQQNEANQEYRTLLAGAYETNAKFEIRQKRYPEALWSVQQSFDVAVGKTESEMRLLSEPQYQQLRTQQIDTSALLATVLYRSGDVTKAEEQLEFARLMAERRGYEPNGFNYPESVLDAARIMGKIDDLLVEKEAKQTSDNEKPEDSTRVSQP